MATTPHPDRLRQRGSFTLYPPIISPNNAHGDRRSGFNLYPPLFPSIPLNPPRCPYFTRIFDHHVQHQISLPLGKSRIPPPAAASSGGQIGVTDLNATQVPNLYGEEGEEIGEEDEEEAVYVLTDEWAEFFAKSEAKRQLERKKRKNQKRVASD